MKPKGRGACPTFFVARCHEAQQGGFPGYEQVGYTLASTIGSMCPDWLEDEEWAVALDELHDLITTGSDSDVLTWFDRHVPRCLALVPRRRRYSLLKGVYRYVIEEGNAIDL
jgi:hypothetical protein